MPIAHQHTRGERTITKTKGQDLFDVATENTKILYGTDPRTRIDNNESRQHYLKPDCVCCRYVFVLFLVALEKPKWNLESRVANKGEKIEK
jgi:hypothetical protein